MAGSIKKYANPYKSVIIKSWKPISYEKCEKAPKL